jgi:hypothetical protein
MANEEYLAILRQGVEVWNRWREENPDIRVNLSEADLRGADLSRARLNRANFFGANLHRADLSEADLSGADLTKAYVWHIVFGDLDLSLVKGLEAVKHGGPSTIGLDTIYKSGGKIPDAFLHGCGVPDNFIAYMGSLTGKAFDYYSCFISYSTKDDAFAQRLHNDLQGEGVRCWFAPQHVKAGEKLYPQIDQAICLHDKLLLILSEDSMHSE